MLFAFLFPKEKTPTIDFHFWAVPVTSCSSGGEAKTSPHEIFQIDIVCLPVEVAYLSQLLSQQFPFSIYNALEYCRVKTGVYR